MSSEALAMTPGDQRAEDDRRCPRHYYVSTACHHELHDRCREVCKFCTAKCQCHCHEGNPK